VETLRDTLFLNDAQVAILLDNFFNKLPVLYKNRLSYNCES